MSDWPSATRRTAVTSSGPRICLRRYPLAPARTAEKRASSSANEVSIKHLSSGMAARRSRQTSMPLPPGKRTSSTATSGRVGGTLVIASSALDASPTTSKSSWASNSSRSPRRHDLVVVEQEDSYGHGSSELAELQVSWPRQPIA